MSDLNVRLLISAENNSSPALQQTRDDVQGVDNSVVGLQSRIGKIGAVAATIASAVAGYFSVKLFGSAVSDAIEFERQMSVVSSVSNATGDDLKNLEDAAKEMGDKTQYTATEAAKALEELGKAGLTVTQQIEALPNVLSLAQANGLNLADAAGYITRVVSGMGMSFSDSARVADVLTKAASSSNTSVDGLGSALSYVAPIARTMGLSLEETTAYIAKLADAGIDASRAGTGLNGILSDFQDPSSKFRQALVASGITTTDFTQALGELQAKGRAGETAILALGLEAGPALRSLLNQGIPAVTSLSTELETAGGSAKTAAVIMSDNLDGAVKNVESSWDTLKLQLAQPILDPLKNSLIWLTGKLQSLSKDKGIEKIGILIADTFKNASIAIQKFADSVDIDSTIAAITTLKNNIVELFGTVWNDSVFTRFNTLLSKVYDGVLDLGKGISDIVVKMADAGVVSQFLSSLFDSVSTLIDVTKQLSTPFIDLFSTIAGGNSVIESSIALLTEITQTATVFVSAFSTGLETLTAAFFGVSGGFSKFIEHVVLGVKKVQEGFAEITFGDVSRKWQAAAAESQRIAESFAKSAQINFDKAQQSMDRVSISAEKTRSAFAAWDGSSVEKTTASVNGLSTAVATLTTKPSVVTVTAETETATAALEAFKKSLSTVDKNSKTVTDNITQETAVQVAVIKKGIDDKLKAIDLQTIAEAKKEALRTAERLKAIEEERLLQQKSDEKKLAQIDATYKAELLKNTGFTQQTKQLEDQKKQSKLSVYAGIANYYNEEVEKLRLIYSQENALFDAAKKDLAKMATAHEKELIGIERMGMSEREKISSEQREFDETMAKIAAERKKGDKVDQEKINALLTRAKELHSEITGEAIRSATAQSEKDDAIYRAKDRSNKIYDTEKKVISENATAFDEAAKTIAAGLDTSNAKLTTAKTTVNDISTALSTEKKLGIAVDQPSLNVTESIINRLTKPETKTITIVTVNQSAATATHPPVEGHQNGAYISGYPRINGFLPGYGGGDTVRALLEKGEGVINKEAVRKLGGEPAVNELNAGRLPIRRATGGMVTDQEVLQGVAQAKAAEDSRIIADMLANVMAFGGIGHTTLFGVTYGEAGRNMMENLHRLRRDDLIPYIREAFSGMENRLVFQDSGFDTMAGGGLTPAAQRRKEQDQEFEVRKKLLIEKLAQGTPGITPAILDVARQPLAINVPNTPLSSGAGSRANTPLSNTTHTVNFTFPGQPPISGDFTETNAKQLLGLLAAAGARTSLG